MYGGAGLGLSISDRLISLLGGRMGLISPEQGGALFWFDLPLRAAQPPKPEPGSSMVNTREPHSILVVDDTPVNLLVVEILLKKFWPECVIHKAESGAHALQACHKNTFTLVLMDVVMPVMDGIETTTRLLSPSFSSFANRPYVVGLNANVNPQDLDAFYKAGLSGLLLKPFNRDQLIGLIHQFLSNPVNRP
jgi:CheY-like chemotaxis protein